MNGTYTSFAAPTLSRTIACTEAYALSNEILHLLGISLWLLFAITCRPRTRNSTISEYSPRLVNDRLNCPKIGAFNPTKLVTWNCSNGELMKNVFDIFKIISL